MGGGSWLLALCSRESGAQGIVLSAWNQTGIDHMQGQCLNPCSVPPPLTSLFYSWVIFPDQSFKISPLYLMAPSHTLWRPQLSALSVLFLLGGSLSLLLLHVGVRLSFYFLTHYTEHDTFLHHPHYSKRHMSIVSHSGIVFHCVYTLQFLYPFICCWALRLF